MTPCLKSAKPIKTFLFFILLLLIFAPYGGALSIDAETQFGYAGACFNEGRYQEALSEYRRFLFFFPKDQRRIQVYYRMGMAEFNLKDYGAALDTFQQAFVSNDAACAFSSGIMMARCCKAMGRIDEALALLDRLIETVALPRNRDFARYEKGWLLMEEGRMKDGRSIFLGIGPKNQVLLKVPDLLNALDRNGEAPQKSPLAAGLLSLFPGAGYLYCERYQDALFSFVVNAALIGATLEAIDHDLPIIGGVIGFTAMGFYGGNMVGSMGSARKYNERENRDFFESLLQNRKIHISIDPEKEGLRMGLEMTY